jgi:hypothetical protein
MIRRLWDKILMISYRSAKPRIDDCIGGGSPDTAPLATDVLLEEADGQASASALEAKLKTSSPLLFLQETKGNALSSI